MTVGNLFRNSKVTTASSYYTALIQNRLKAFSCQERDALIVRSSSFEYKQRFPLPHEPETSDKAQSVRKSQVNRRFFAPYSSGIRERRKVGRLKDCPSRRFALAFLAQTVSF